MSARRLIGKSFLERTGVALITGAAIVALCWCFCWLNFG